MKAGREVLFAIVMMILTILACSIPGVASPGGDVSTDDETQPQPSPEVTYVVVVENTATPIPTETPIPATPTPQIAPKLTLTKNSNCRMGPSNFYNITDQITSGKELPVIGRSENSEWWQVVNDTGRECWIYYENATPNQDFNSLAIGEAPNLPGMPASFFVVDQLCQPGPKTFSITLSWASGGGETAFRLYRDGGRIGEFKANRFNYKDPNAPLNKNLTYEIESVNEYGTSEKAIQIIPACK
jgi:hypothetical protein